MSQTNIEPSSSFRSFEIEREDFIGGAVLIISTASNQLLDLGSWQRVFASQSEKDTKIGLVAAGWINFVCQTAMASLGNNSRSSYYRSGVVALASFKAGNIEIPGGQEHNSFFILLNNSNPIYSALTLVLATVLAASTVDSLQNGLVVAFASLSERKTKSLHCARLFALIVRLKTAMNIFVQLICASATLAITNQSVLSIFLVSNIASLCVLPPIFLGLSPYVATPRGALIGLIAGLATLFCIGWVFMGSIFCKTWTHFNHPSASCDEVAVVPQRFQPLDYTYDFSRCSSSVDGKTIQFNSLSLKSALLSFSQSWSCTGIPRFSITRSNYYRLWNPKIASN